MDTIEIILKKNGLNDLGKVSSIYLTEDYIKWDSFDLRKFLSQNELSYFMSEILTKDLSYFPNLDSYTLWVTNDFKFSNTFFSSKSLKKIYINGGKLLSSIKFDLPILEELTFSNVLCSKLNSTLLQSTNLKKLHLYYLNIKSLPDNLHHLNQLKSLSVYNKIENLDNITFPNSLETIDLRGNKISEINTNIITENIKTIDISQNPLFKINISESKRELTLILSDTPLGCFEDNYKNIRNFLPNVFFSPPTYNPIDSSPKKYDFNNYDQYLIDFYKSLNDKWRIYDWNKNKLEDPEYKRPFRIKKQLITIKKSDLHKTEINIV